MQKKGVSMLLYGRITRWRRVACLLMGLITYKAEIDEISYNGNSGEIRIRLQSDKGLAIVLSQYPELKHEI